MIMSNDKNKYALILGANSDIAKALAYKLAQAGYDLQLAARNCLILEKIKSDIQLRFDKKVELYEYDATNFSIVPSFFKSLIVQQESVIMAVGLFYQQKDIEVNNCTDIEKAKNLTVTNFLGPALLLEHIAAELSQNKTMTTIVAISSVAGDRGRAKNYWYGAGKSALTVFLSGLRQKYNNSNLSIITVKPGFVATKMLKGELTPKVLTATPEQTADMILSSIKNKKTIVYPWKWWIIMTVIKLLPERLFMKLKF